MKKAILFLAVSCTTIFFSCSNSKSVSPGEKFIGTWKRIPPNRMAVGLESMGWVTRIAIKKDGELYLVKMSTMSDQPFGPDESVFELKEDKLVGEDGIIYYLESSGHLKTEKDEWEKMSNNTW